MGSDYEQLTQGYGATGARPLIPDVSGPTQQSSYYFKYQSYLDTALYENAIEEQDPSNPIVTSTKQSSTLSGYGIALSPSSQTPVAVTFKPGGQTVILRPGDVWRPRGKVGGQPSSFSGFDWGLPFGWLGGGLATLIVLQSPDAEVAWGSARPEILFHRLCIPIAANGGALVARTNWPTRFPWFGAARGATKIAQAGSPILNVEPSRVIMRLNANTLAAAADMAMLFLNPIQDYDAVHPTPPNYTRVDMTWPAYSDLSVPLDPVYYQIEFKDGPLCRLDAWGLHFLDLSGGSLANLNVDVLRYGRL